MLLSCFVSPFQYFYFKNIVIHTKNKIAPHLFLFIFLYNKYTQFSSNITKVIERNHNESKGLSVCVCGRFSFSFLPTSFCQRRTSLFEQLVSHRVCARPLASRAQTSTAVAAKLLVAVRMK